MARKQFAVQHTGRPYGPMESIPSSRWSTISEHTSLDAARKRQADEVADMRKACGPNAWNDHFRIISLVDRQMQVHFACEGVSASDYRPCSNRAEHTVRFTWPAGEACQTPLKPQGWDSSYQCADCYAAEQAIYNAEEATR